MVVKKQETYEQITAIVNKKTKDVSVLERIPVSQPRVVSPAEVTVTSLTYQTTYSTD